MKKKRSVPHTPKPLNNEEKKLRLDGEVAPVEHGELSHFQSEASFVGEYCNVHLRPSSTVKAMSYNRSIGRLCVIRQIDLADGQPSTPLTLVEFYNASNPPIIFLEKNIPVNDHFETLVWMGEWAVLGGLGGRTTLLSPFTSKFGRVQVCVSDIIVMAWSGKNQFVVGNNSSELLVLNTRDDTVDEERLINKVPAFSTVQTIKLSSDEHITSLVCSKTLKAQKMAVGKVNGLSLFVRETRWNKQREIDIPHTKNNANVIWSLIFVDSFLFTGDARGQMCIYDAENGTLLKTLRTHQSPLLAIASNGREVFAAGADYRMQIIKRISHNNGRFDWQPSGQRLFHANDVRAICVLDKQWLVSGGSEQEFFISDKYTHATPQIKSECAFFVTNSNCYVVVSLHLSHLDLWCKTMDDGSSADQRNCLRRLLRITSGNLGFIKQFCISADGKFLAFAGAIGGAVRVFQLNSDQIPALLSTDDPGNIGANKLIKLIWSSKQGDEDVQKLARNTGGKAVSAICCTERFLYFARGEFILVRLDLQTKRLRPFVAKVNGGHVTKICVDSADSHLVALTIAGILCVDLTQMAYETDQIGADGLTVLKLPTEAPAYDCAFYDKCKIIFLTADLSQHVILYDLSSNATLFAIGSAKLNLVPNEWVAYLHSNSSGAIVATSNKARLRLLTLYEGKMRLFAQEPAEYTGEKVAKSISARIEPFWLEDWSNQSANCSKTKFVLVRHMEENNPSRVPCRLRFFGKN